MREDVADECIDDVRLAFRFDLHGVLAHVAHEAVHVITRRDPAYRFTKEDALNRTPNLHVLPLAHVKA